MLKVYGRDIFENNVFSWESWSADVLQMPNEVRDAFDRLNLCGNIISNIAAVGYVYNLAQYRLADDDDSWLYKDEAIFPCCIIIDEPMIISLRNGDRLEIEFSDASSVRISKNCLPHNIVPGTNANNVDVAKLFSCCLSETIVGLEIKSTDKYPWGTGSHGIILAEGKDEYIESVNILLSNAKKLKFEDRYDYCCVTVTNEAGEPLDVSFADVKLALLNYN